TSSHFFTSFFLLLLPPPLTSTLFPYTTLFRSNGGCKFSSSQQPRSQIGSRRGGRRGLAGRRHLQFPAGDRRFGVGEFQGRAPPRSEEHTSELQSLAYLVCRLLLEKKKTNSEPP